MTKQLKLSNIVVGVIFVEAETRGIPSSSIVYHYHYQVPEVMLPETGFKPGDYVIVKGASERVCLARIDEVIDTTTRRTKATVPIIGTVDISHFAREREKQAERERLLAALNELEKKRLQEAKFAELAKTDAAAAELVNQLRALDA